MTIKSIRTDDIELITWEWWQSLSITFGHRSVIIIKDEPFIELEFLNGVVWLTLNTESVALPHITKRNQIRNLIEILGREDES